MGWIEDTGRHEGFVKAVFADGQLGGGTWGGGDRVSVDGSNGLHRRDESGASLWRPSAAVVGWRIACDHVPSSVPDEDLGHAWVRTEQWLSPQVWHRVYSPADEDLDQRRIYASLDDSHSVDLMGRAEGDDHLEERLLTEWRAHIEPEDHARSIRTALDALAAAKQTLDLEVAAGRTAGLSWADIGRVAGITRQAARDRWGTS